MGDNSSPTRFRLSISLSTLAWVAALSLVGVALYLGWQRFSGGEMVRSSPRATVQADKPAAGQSMDEPVSVALPAVQRSDPSGAITRRTELHTIIPNRPRQEVRDYTVDTGDSVFEIALKFNLKPETILWANYATLNDNPDMISLGMDLKIPPVNGVYYEWQEWDTVEGVAGKFEAKVEDILNFPGNNFDLINPQKEPGEWIMVPGGHREFRQWLIPTIPRGAAGVSKALYGGGACEGGYEEGALGTGGFVWPAGNHALSGNDYWDGHLAIDIGLGEGSPIYAADSGVAVFAGTATGGYGNMILLDHGNGYQTLYAHLSRVAISCGRSVVQGGTIGYAGSTGNSTGTHLHFEVRFQGGFVNPWYVLPPP